MSTINPITDLEIMMQSGKVTYIDLEVYGLPATNQEDLKTAVETLTTSITDKVAASDRFTPVEREFVRALMANVADNGLLDGAEYKQLPTHPIVTFDVSKIPETVTTYSPADYIHNLLRSDQPSGAIVQALGQIIEHRRNASSSEESK